MKVQDIKDYIEKEVGESISTKSRKRRLSYYRSVYVKLCRKYVKSQYGSPVSYDTIGEALNRHHASVMYLQSKVFKEAIEHDDLCRDIYNEFIANVNGEDAGLTDKQKLRMLNKNYLSLLNKYNQQKVGQKEVYKVLDDLNEDKIPLFIDRVRPMIRMLNKAKFQ